MPEELPVFSPDPFLSESPITYHWTNRMAGNVLGHISINNSDPKKENTFFMIWCYATVSLWYSGTFSWLSIYQAGALIPSFAVTALAWNSFPARWWILSLSELLHRCTPFCFFNSNKAYHLWSECLHNYAGEKLSMLSIIPK